MKNSIIYICVFLITFQSFSQINKNFKKKRVVQVQQSIESNNETVSDGTFDIEKYSYNFFINGKTRHYTVNGQNFLFSLDYSTGQVSIRKMSLGGAVEEVIKEYRWKDGWNYEFYTVNNQTYLFLLKKYTGTVHIRLMNTDGTVGDLILDKKWTKGWNIELYTSNNQPYLFLYKMKLGDDPSPVRIHKINSDGSVGNLLTKYGWSAGWTTTKTYTINNQTYLFLYKTGSGTAKVHKIDEDGKVGELIMERDWTKGWDPKIYSKNDQMYLFIEKSSGLKKIHTIGERGIVGDLVKEYTTNQETVITFYTISNNTYALVNHSSDGTKVYSVK